MLSLIFIVGANVFDLLLLFVKIMDLGSGVPKN